MKIFIITIEDPLITNTFIRKVISLGKNEIVGIAKVEGSKVQTHKKSNIEYLFCLFWILGPFVFLTNILKSFAFKLDVVLSLITGFPATKSVKNIALKHNVPYHDVKNINSEHFISELKSLSPDIIINQCQFILKNKILEIPNIGVINRHNALLPRNRGRISPFWVIHNSDKETGVSIHLVDERIDEGPIIFQFKYPVHNLGFNSLVKTNYRIAPLAMLKAIQILEKDVNYRFEKNSLEPTYNSTPQFTNLVNFLKQRSIYSIFFGV